MGTGVGLGTVGDIATLVFQGMSSLAAVVQAYWAARKLGRGPTAEEIDTAEREAETAAAGAPAAKQLKVIGDDILEVILENIEKSRERLKKSLKDPNNDDTARDLAIDKANSSICAELQRVKRLNGGNLPGDPYETWWMSHGCS
jgi:hypothetical protein